MHKLCSLDRIMDGLAEKHHGVYDHRIIDCLHLIPAHVILTFNSNTEREKKKRISVRLLIHNR